MKDKDAISRNLFCFSGNGTVTGNPVTVTLLSLSVSYRNGIIRFGITGTVTTPFSYATPVFEKIYTSTSLATYFQILNLSWSDNYRFVRRC